MQLDDPAGFPKFIHDVLKILHVRTHHDRFAGQDRFGTGFWPPFP